LRTAWSQQNPRLQVRWQLFLRIGYLNINT
jgi:hypothetical protein